MDIEEIKTLTDLMVNNDLSEIMIRDGDKRVVIRRGGGVASYVTAPPPAPAPGALAPPAPVAGSQTAPAGEVGATVEDPGLVKIPSPMVGTFYCTPDPDSPPYVQIGDKVNPDTVICIIEAMKVFNEIKAEASGTVESIDVQNGEPVEFGQVIMTVRVG
ncbi:MAG: acetyl-CoA carboxylase biotin carboxyl carrier protein [Phycisphaerae bacterium]|nr:acetyl-CoA carboxylase biotin carboxyl carrier protein [Phycisphaerae bacterium]